MRQTHISVFQIFNVAQNETTEVSPWNDQKYKITGGLKSILQVPNLILRLLRMRLGTCKIDLSPPVILYY